MLEGATFTAILALMQAGAFGATPADATELTLERDFAGTVRPFLERHCLECHGKEKLKGKLDLGVYTTVSAVAQDYRRWEILLEKLKAEEMPPEEAKSHPAPELRKTVVDWILTLRQFEADRNAGDPGPVLARRLSNAEYDYTVRDLTGVDIRPTREFPVDPANEAGFDNSGESLAMSSALLKKYLEAARSVAEHVVLKPQGFVFAPHPAVTETDRDKYCVKRIVDFYQRQPTGYADYFVAAWRYKHRAEFGKPNATLASLAREHQVSPKYLATLWSLLTEAEADGPIAALQSLWSELPAPDGGQPNAARPGCERMREFVIQLRQKLKPEFQNLALRGVSSGSQPLVLWKDRQYATNRMRSNPEALRRPGGANPAAAPEDASRPREEADPHFGFRTSDFGFQVVRLVETVRTNTPNAPAGAWAEKAANARTNHAVVLFGDESKRPRYEKAFERFCRVFPDAFYVSERGRIFLQKDEGDRGRLLSAGFHLMVGYFRDDAPLCELILDDLSRRELDALWQELDFITLAPVRQYKDFIFFERAEPPRFAQGAEFDFARSEDKDSTAPEKMKQMAETYLAKARGITNEGPAIEAIQHYFENISADIRRVERARSAAEKTHLEALRSFAHRAYRRPLSQEESGDLVAYYQSLRDRDGLDHEEAVRDAIVAVLMSPHFLYLNLAVGLDESGRVGWADQAPTGQNTADTARASGAKSRDAVERVPAGLRAAQPLSDYALASRLSYFLWSSLPDAELLARAATGDLHRPEILTAQARRMLKDGRVRGLATEFGGNWLDFRRFEEHNAVDRERFPAFDNELRQAMFEEPIQFFVQLIREDRSVLDFIYADYTFVNAVLAKHYGMPDLRIALNEWARVEGASRYERGGLLPMSAFLTKNSPGLRTSPVKRGYWVVRRLLGEYIPPPPTTVPELPADEAKLGDLSLREMLAKHREDKSCASCHEHFDSFGLVFEGYGPVGERRAQDMGGRPVDTRAAFPGGREGAGLEGLRSYLRAHREDDFLDNLCRKLLAYALGRTLMLSDDGLVRDMRAKLAANGYRFSTLVESLVTSSQFLTKRIRDELPRN
jgi:mono/diheme cytochrome c family protein